MECVTLFYNDLSWRRDESNYDFRTDAQILPAGSVVFGFIKVNHNTQSIDMLARPPYDAKNERGMWDVITNGVKALQAEWPGYAAPLKPW